MARIIPAVANIRLPSTALATPRNAIKAGSTALEGHLQAFGEACNLAHATANAGVDFAMGWADGQLVVNDAAYTMRLRTRIPYVSDVNTDLLCSAYAFAPAAAFGSIRFTCVGNGNVAVVALGAALAITPTSTLSLSGGFVAHADGDYAEITVETKDNCSIRNLWAVLADYSPGALYPGADDAYPAGPVGAFIPFDDGEMVADAPVSADLLHQRRAGIADTRTRRRQFYTWAGVLNSATASMYSWPAPIRHMGVFPVISGTASEPRTLTLWAYGQRALAGPPVGVTIRDLATGRALGSVEYAAGTGASWKNATVQLAEERQAGAPAEYPGFMLCYCDFLSQRPGGSEGDPALDAQYDAASSINSVVVFGQ
jgi:hypothetical protein